jgi:hypothetical protein
MIIPPEASSANDLAIQTEAQEDARKNKEWQSLRNNCSAVVLRLWHQRGWSSLQVSPTREYGYGCVGHVKAIKWNRQKETDWKRTGRSCGYVCGWRFDDDMLVQLSNWEWRKVDENGEIKREIRSSGTCEILCPLENCPDITLWSRGVWRWLVVELWSATRRVIGPQLLDLLGKFRYHHRQQ